MLLFICNKHYSCDKDIGVLLILLSILPKLASDSLFFLFFFGANFGEVTNPFSLSSWSGFQIFR